MESYRNRVARNTTVYGGSAYAFYADPNMPDFPLDRWEEIHAAFYAKYKRLGQWQDELYNLVCQQGWYQSFTGRKYTFKKIKKRDGSMVYNRPDICNYCVQGTCTADFVPLVMMVIRKGILDAKLDAQINGQVHDSIIIDCSKKDVDEAAKIVYNAFRGLDKVISKYWNVDWPVEFTGEVEVGPNYKETQMLYDKKGKVASVYDLVF